MAVLKRNDQAKSQTSILIVDDEKVIRDLCARALMEYRVFQAGNCADAVRVYEKERTDLVLADVMMPGGDGIQLLRQIKKLDPNAAVIIMTGFADKEIILNALKEGADDFISKPLNLLQLKTVMEKALARNQLKEELATLKQLDRLKSNFLSLISHKLRTPITAISLFLQNIQRGVYDTSDALFLQNVNLINEEAAYLNRMVNDLLTFSQMMEGSSLLHVEPCDLNIIVGNVLQGSREALRKPGVTTEFSERHLPAIYLDRAKIAFALQQVIDNAYKFSGETGRVSIHIRDGEDNLTVIVADSGAGIPQEELTRVFDKFYQIDPDNTGQVRGFGLGLFYAREFVRQHGGNLDIASEAGKGTSVTITLPVQPTVSA
ncbi:hybrid sensor histidine kinase/response regulator [Pelotalea chapellei]|uniref:histidine kinase n=1 Tax=Pelotalea chapellei TaxID=44671 RepID=A0ABS5U9J3_9BACT|nr:hybrid sensor histidine kinase/response regulator [Pelotalea chapellei]MBT1072329.1 response regulator [Pelotalea chapellei]